MQNILSIQKYKMFIVKKHTHNNQLLLSIIDEDLIGKKIVEGKKELNLTSTFYAGEEMSKEEILNLIKKAVQLNVVGKKIVSFLEKEGHIEHVLEINDIPYALIVINKN